MKSSNRSLVILVFVILVAFLGAAIIQGRTASRTQELPFSQLMAQVEEGKVERLVVRGQSIEGRLKDGTALKSVGPADHEWLTRAIADHDLQAEVEVAGSSVLLPVLTNLLPLLLLGGLVIFILRQIQASSGRAMSFGKSRARLHAEGGKKVTFEDVAGAEEAKAELEEVVQFLKDPRRFTRLGGRIPKGVLLMGPPGTGKTLLARAVAGEAGVPFFSLSGSDFVEMFVGVGASRVRDLFEQAKKQSPCIIFVDEIDAVGRNRGPGFGGGHDEREQTLNQLLVEMDGFEGNEGIILMAATNRADVLDPALLRPGRFDRRVVVSNPDVRGRLGILKVHTRRTPLDPSVDLERVARGTAGFSGADLENLVNEAALAAARRGREAVLQDDFEEAKDKVSMGAERRSLVVPEKERRRTAYHEAGHAVVAWLMPDADTVSKISIVPRGRALGVTLMLPDEDRLGATAGELHTLITVLMGGRVAELLIFEEMTTGASDDLRRASRIARAMVTEYGMSARLGAQHLIEDQDAGMMGLSRGRSFAEATTQAIDEEAKRILDEGEALARSVLRQNLHILEKLAQLLLEKETVDGAELSALLSSMNPVYPAADRA
ncbi:MAG: ATP-dependent zinc metalloprotease FtsH [Deltaproteobacteria bacterium]|nr:ATP-dependent zinc metalloprotease FtsH [Deltaproteobacteria bacterium]